MVTHLTDDSVSGFIHGYLSCVRDEGLLARTRVQLLSALRRRWPNEDERVLNIKLEHVLITLQDGGHLSVTE